MTLCLPPSFSEPACRGPCTSKPLKPHRTPQEPLSLIVDSSGLKVCGQGEWHAQKHGEKKRKAWKKPHIGVDDQGRIVASTVTESNEQDPSQVPERLDQIEEEIDRFFADGICDQEVRCTSDELSVVYGYTTA